MVVIKIKVNVNKSRTLEQNLELRKQTVITAGENLKKEILFDLKLLSHKTADLSDFNRGFEILKVPSPDWFNSDTNYKSALETLLNLKQRTIGNLVRQLAEIDHAVRAKSWLQFSALLSDRTLTWSTRNAHKLYVCRWIRIARSKLDFDLMFGCRLALPSYLTRYDAERRTWPRHLWR